jgi:hypothetical protein
MTTTPLAALKHHVTGAIERGEKEAIVGIPARTKLQARTERVTHYSMGRRSKTYRCTLSDTGWEVTGPNKEQLYELLGDVLKRQADYLHTRRYVRKDNVTFALYYANGWQYDIVRDDGSASTCMLNCQSYADALERMLKHAANHCGE